MARIPIRRCLSHSLPNCFLTPHTRPYGKDSEGFCNITICEWEWYLFIAAVSRTKPFIFIIFGYFGTYRRVIHIFSAVHFPAIFHTHIDIQSNVRYGFGTHTKYSTKHPYTQSNTPILRNGQNWLNICISFLISNQNKIALTRHAYRIQFHCASIHILFQAQTHIYVLDKC